MLALAAKIALTAQGADSDFLSSHVVLTLVAEFVLVSAHFLCVLVHSLNGKSLLHDAMVGAVAAEAFSSVCPGFWRSTTHMLEFMCHDVLECGEIFQAIGRYRKNAVVVAVLRGTPELPTVLAAKEILV
jgi:hypothetical protein